MKNEPILASHYLKSDKIMLGINGALIVYSLLLASWYNTWIESIVISGITAVALTVIYSIAPATIISRMAMATGLMIMTALHIHQAHGMIELHFGVFLLLAVLLYYRDWLPILTAAVVIAVHHFLFFYLQTKGSSIWMLASADNGWWVVFMHAGYVIVESALFIWLSIDLHKDAMQSTEIMVLTDNIITDDAIDLTLRSSGSTSLLNRFDSYTQEVEQLAQQVKNAAKQLDGDGRILANITEEMRNGAHTQQRETDMIAAAIEEMSNASKEISNNAEIAAESANEVDKSATEATNVSERTREAVEQLAQQVDQASLKITELHGHSKSISLVLDVIRGVAEQTNLLALNAAIEAARAGEHGRGFAVVADEVRTLAQRTQQSTQEIDKTIEALQASSESAVEAIESSRNLADSCVENTQGSLQLMENVSSSISEINRMNMMIAAASGQQTSVIHEISSNLSNILSASNKAAEDSSSAAQSGTVLLQLSVTMTKLAQRFKVTE